MKLLSVIINGRIDHTLNFDARHPYPNNYIAQIGAGACVNLMKFNTSGNRCVIHTDTEDTKYSITNLFLTETDGESIGNYQVKNIEFLFTLNTTNNNGTLVGGGRVNEQNNPNRRTVFGVQQYWRDNTLTLPIEGEHVYNVTIKFDVRDTNPNRYADIHISVAPKECIWDVVLDYGSEASQLLVSPRSQNITINNLCTLFDEFYMTHKGYIPTNDDERANYIQYDTDNVCYYKSLFYIKRRFNNDDRINVTAPLGKQTQDDITLLNEYRNQANEKADYMILPNLKIANHGGVQLPNILYGNNFVTAPQIGDRTVYRKIVNAFMQIAIKKTLIGEDNPRFLNVILLVPNTYRQDEVSKALTHLASDIVTLSADQSNVNGVEVSSISESDASFVGVKQCMNNDNPLANTSGKYLIMDAGKGTLDFSVIEDNNNNLGHRYNSTFRSGIIGAGNAISYSVLLAILNHIFSKDKDLANDKIKREKKITEFVNSKILINDADLAEVTSLMRGVERYKRLYNNGELTQKSHPIVVPTQTLDITALNNLIKNMCEQKIIVCDESYINNMIDNICFAVSNKLKGYYPTSEKYKIDHIIFAGRGFLMNKLRQRMEEVLKKYNNSICGSAETHNFEDIVNNTANTITPKNICMFIINAIRDGKYNVRLVGTPFIALDTNETPTPSTEPNGEEVKTPTTIMDKILNGVNWAIERIIPTHFNEPSEKGVVTTQRDIILGYSDTITDNNDVLAVSGMRYSIQSPLRNHTEKVRVKIFFDGSDFVIRREKRPGINGGGILDISPMYTLDGNYVFESTFPFLLAPANGDSIPFPKESEEPTKCTVTENDESNDNDDFIEQQLHNYKSRNNQ